MSRPTILMCVALGLMANDAFPQQNPNGVLPLYTTNQPYLFLVRDPAVHQELQLSHDQLRQLTELNDRIDLPMWSMRNKTAQQIAKTMAESTEATKQALASILSNDQNDRIQQIELWVLGMKSLLREDVALRIGLTSDQRSSIREIVLTKQHKMQDLQTQLQDGGDAETLNQRYRQLQVDQQQEIVALLSDQQKQQWAGMLGNRVDVSKLGRIKFRAPELQSATAWVNSEPLTLQQLKGKVVALHFYAFA